MSPVFQSRYLPCPWCGASVERGELDHRCNPERYAEFQAFRLRGDVARLGVEIDRWLDSKAGRFEQWLAARQVRGR